MKIDEDLKGGWGISVLTPGYGFVNYFGPLVVGGRTAPMRALNAITNNTAEVVALYCAALFILSQPAGLRYYILFDSKYAAYTFRQMWRARSNLQLIRETAQVMDRACNHAASIIWRWIKGHSGSEGNDHADASAKNGANGRSQLWEDG